MFMIQADLSNTLIIKPSSLGDVIQALPVAWALRALNERARIDWMVMPGCAGVLEGLEPINEVVLFDRRRYGRMWRNPAALADFAKFVRRLRKARYTTVIDLQGLLRSGLLAWLSGARTRIGLAGAREGAGRFYSHTVPVPGEISSVDRYMLAAEAVGAEAGQERQFDLSISPQHYQAACDLLTDHGFNSRQQYVVLVPGARWASKRWPVESWASLIACIRRDLDMVPVIIGGPDERQTAEQIRALDCGPVIDLVGQTSLKVLAAVLEGARVVVTNDTGPMHLASAVGRPVVAIFGPTNVHRTGPYGAGHVLLEGRADCAPCYSRECCFAGGAEELVCLRRITVGEVVESLNRLREVCP